MQHGRMDHNVIRAARLRMAGQLHHRVEILIAGRKYRARRPIAFLDRNFDIPLPLRQRHGEKLALLSGHKQPRNTQIIHPMPDVGAKARLVE